MDPQADSLSPHGSRTAFRAGGPRRWLILLLFLALITPIGLVAARQLAPDAASPATRHAQVITQGIAQLNGQNVVWRLVERSADTRERAKFGERGLGFVLASEEPVLLTNATDAGLVEVARVAPGEAFLVTAGIRQMRASMTDHSVKYLSLELVTAADANQIGGGKLLFKSAPFTAPTGDRDLDLVRDMLTQAEETIIPDSGHATVILASEGAIDIVPSGGRMRTLQAGEAGIFEGELRVRPAAASANADKPLLAVMTEKLNQDSAAPRAAFVAGVIGVEIPPLVTETPTRASIPPVPTEIPVVQAPTDTPLLPTETTAPTETATETATTAPTDTPTPTVTPTLAPIGVIPRLPMAIIFASTPTPVVIA